MFGRPSKVDTCDVLCLEDFSALTVPFPAELLSL